MTIKANVEAPRGLQQAVEAGERGQLHGLPDPRPHTFPVVEIFGPTVQGEGPDAGQPCAFVRLGGCDYRCSWCDSMHAVEPALVRQAERIDHHEIVRRLDALDGEVQLVILSGGNPALHQLGALVGLLHRRRGRARPYRVSVETQGSVWRPWLRSVDRLVVSPKPPSSRMASPDRRAATERFMEQAMAAHGAGGAHRLALKVVVFDQADLRYAAGLARQYDGVPLYLSVGTPQDRTGRMGTTDDQLNDTDQVRLEVADRYRWLCEQVAQLPVFARARVLPQLHVIAWGPAQGV